LSRDAELRASTILFRMNQQPTRFQKVLSTGFGSGYSPFAPGTMGALLAEVVWLVLYLFLPYQIELLVTAVLTVALTYYGVRASGAVEAIWGKDPSRVVVDEMVGVLLPLFFVPPMTENGWWWYAIAAFVLFRLFDIFKPLGIRRMERFPGGIGIMADDVLAGVYSALIIWLAQWIIG
jgi:phosphatidylglycerophosphatase A